VDQDVKHGHDREQSDYDCRDKQRPSGQAQGNFSGLRREASNGEQRNRREYHARPESDRVKEQKTTPIEKQRAIPVGVD